VGFFIRKLFSGIRKETSAGREISPFLPTSPPPPPLLLFLLAFLCALLTFWPQLLKRWITLFTEKRKCFSLILTYPLDSAIQRLNIPGLNAWIRPPQPLVQEVFFPFSLRVSVEIHLRLFEGKEDLTEKNQSTTNLFPG